MASIQRSHPSPSARLHSESIALKRISKKKDKFQGDRFIPNRSSTNAELASFLLSQSTLPPDPALQTPEPSQFQKFITDSFFPETVNTPQTSRIFSFTNRPKTLPFVDSLNQSLSALSIKPCEIGFSKARTISQVPERILDAPEIIDDYYLNLMDWGENGLLAVSLNQSVYLWNCYSGEIATLLSTSSPENYICSVDWMNQGGNLLAIGFADHSLQLWDASSGQQIRGLKGHTSRVSSLSWNGHILTSGSRDTWILNHDIRARNNVVSSFEGHKQEVCGLKWSPDGRFLASGGNDNNLFIWEMSSRRKNFRNCFNEHTAAVKALSWCPWQRGLLVSGGGTADKTMKFWDVERGKLVQNLNVESQVCSVLWNPFEKELLSSHGFSKNQLIVWRFPSMEKMTELNGHTNRVLHTCLSPDGTTVVSAGADETLRFWKVFEAPNAEDKGDLMDLLQEPSCNLR